MSYIIYENNRRSELLGLAGGRGVVGPLADCKYLDQWRSLETGDRVGSIGREKMGRVP